MLNHYTFRRSVLILSSYVRLGLLSGLFSQSFTIKIIYRPFLSPTRYMSLHFSLTDFITRIIFGEVQKSQSPSLCSLLYSPVNSSLLGPNTLLSTLFSNTISLRSSLNITLLRQRFSLPLALLSQIHDKAYYTAPGERNEVSR